MEKRVGTDTETDLTGNHMHMTTFSKKTDQRVTTLQEVAIPSMKMNINYAHESGKNTSLTISRVVQGESRQ